MLMDEVRGEAFLRKLPQDIRDTLSPAQTEAISRVAQGAIQRRHPVDFRASVPLPFGEQAYLVLLLGKEKRSGARRQLDRQLRPTDRLSRIVVFSLGLAAFTLAAFIALLFDNAVLAP